MVHLPLKTASPLLASLFLLGTVFSPSAPASDLGFRYDPVENICKNASGDRGLNPEFLGVCGDLRDFRMTTYDVFEAKLMGADLTPAASPAQRDLVLDYADLRGVKGPGLDFINSSFKGVNFQKSDFSGAVFEVRGQVRPVPFTEADFRFAKFLRASFLLADFSKADLRNADFRGVDCKTCTWTGARFNGETRLPFSDETALRLGMIFDESDPTPVITAEVEPPFPRKARLDFRSGKCADRDSCRKLYGEDSVRGSLRTKGEVQWFLTEVDDRGLTSWLDDENAEIWIEEPIELLLPARQVAAHCAERGAEAPSRAAFTRAYENGISGVLPNLIRKPDAFWTSEASDRPYNEHYYFFHSASGLFQLAWHEDPVRSLCVRPE